MPQGFEHRLRQARSSELAEVANQLQGSRPSEIFRSIKEIDMSKISARVILLIGIFNGCQTIREKASGPDLKRQN